MAELFSFKLDSTAASTLVTRDAAFPPGATVELRADAGDDLFVNPWSGATVGKLHGVGAWLTEPGFTFSALVRVDLRARFDSAILLGWVDESLWFKVCLERDPQGRARVVKV